MTKHEVHLQLLNLEKDGYQYQFYFTAGMDARQIPNYNSWDMSVSMFCRRHLTDHPLYPKIEEALSYTYDLRIRFSRLMELLDTIGKDDEYWKAETPQQMASASTVAFMPSVTRSDSVFPTVMLHQHDQANGNASTAPNSKPSVFIVHGHDSAAKQEMARFLENVGFKAIILHEQPDAGKTIIEKIEANTDVSFAVVLYTECDLGRAKNDSPSQEKFRARQNVVFEHGYLIAKLGRDRVCALVKGDVETPGDISGVVYTKMDSGGAWKLQLVKNMRAVGIAVDANKLL